MQYFRVSLLAAVVVTVPVALYQVYAFAKPGLKKSETFFLKLVILLGLALFVVGVLFAYKLMMPSCSSSSAPASRAPTTSRPPPVSRAMSASA